MWSILTIPTRGAERLSKEEAEKPNTLAISNPFSEKESSTVPRKR